MQQGRRWPAIRIKTEPPAERNAVGVEREEEGGEEMEVAAQRDEGNDGETGGEVGGSGQGAGGTGAGETREGKAAEENEIRQIARPPRRWGRADH